MLYTGVGGFISVVRTDVIQGIIMILAAVVLFVEPFAQPVASDHWLP